MSLHNALSLTVADGMPRLVTFFPDLMDQDYVFFVVEFLGGTSESPGSEQRRQGCSDQVQQFVV